MESMSRIRPSPRSFKREMKRLLEPIPRHMETKPGSSGGLLFTSSQSFLISSGVMNASSQAMR